MNEPLRAELLGMREYDQSVRGELAEDGSLFDGYHPRMESVHRDNAARLRAIIAESGWPTADVVGVDGAEAAWMIAQHSIGEPGFMRSCRDLIDEASVRGAVSRAHFAFIDDRIRVFEGRAQRFGTQLRGGPDGLEPYPLEDPAGVEQRRRDLGMPALSEIIARSRENPPPAPSDQAMKDMEELEWRVRVGWIAP